MTAVIGIDPGSEKCGIAVVEKKKGILLKDVVHTAAVLSLVNEYMESYKIKAVIIGNGTGGKAMKTKLAASLAAGTPLVCVDEYRTTDMARKRYWQDNPPKGWRKCLPVSFQVPPVPVDDYAAVIMAERYLNSI